MFVSHPGMFPCEAILHVCGDRDAAIVEHLVCSIVDHCESYGFNSVAIPAICAGEYFVEKHTEMSILQVLF